jgi:hypothetical protein
MAFSVKAIEQGQESQGLEGGLALAVLAWQMFSPKFCIQFIKNFGSASHSILQTSRND